MTFRRWRAAAAFLLLARCLSGCGAGPSSTATPAAVTTRDVPGAPQDGATAIPLAERQDLRVGVSRNLVNGPSDPWYVHSSLLVWEPLVRLDDALRPIPGLAERWSVTPDGLSWTLTLRPHVSFTDGSRFDADAVLANFSRMRQVSNHASSFFGLDFSGAYGKPERIEKVDEMTVRIVHSRPLPEFPNSISNFRSAMFSPRGFDADGDFTGLPIGTGPFKLVDWQQDQNFTLVRNDGYWGSKPVLTKITGRIYPDANVRLSALRAGEVDALVELGALLPAQGQGLRGNQDFVVLGAPSSCAVYLAYNGLRPPFNEVRLRRAVDLALDRQTLVREIVYGFGAPAQGIITSYAPTIRSQDPAAQVRFDSAQAQRLAREALGGRPARITLLFSPPTRGSFARPLGEIAAYLQATLRSLGLEIELQQLEAAAASDATKAGAFDLALTNGPGCTPFGDPDYPLRRILSSTSTLNLAGNGNGGFHNAEADRLLDEARTTVDATARAKMYDRLQQIAIAEVPISLLYGEQQVIAYRKAVHGLSQRTIYQPTFDTAFLGR